MKNPEALLHVLRRAISNIPPEQIEERRRKELSSSLSVEDDKSFYSIRWQDGQREYSRQYAKSDFVFYHRGDRSENDALAGTAIEDKNSASVSRVLADMTGNATRFLPERLPPPSMPERPRARIGQLPWLLLLFLPIGFLHPPLVPLISILAAIILLERLRYELLFIGFLATAILPWIGLPYTACAGAAAMTAFAVMTPRGTGRLFQLAAIGAVICSCILNFHASNAMVPTMTLMNYLILGACSVAAILRWMRGTHIYLASLMLPFFAFGAALDGYIALSAALVAVTIGPGILPLASFMKCKRSGLADG